MTKTTKCDIIKTVREGTNLTRKGIIHTMKHFFFNHNTAQLNEVNANNYNTALTQHNKGETISVVRWNGQTYETLITW